MVPQWWGWRGGGGERRRVRIVWVVLVHRLVRVRRYVVVLRLKEVILVWVQVWKRRRGLVYIIWINV